MGEEGSRKRRLFCCAQFELMSNCSCNLFAQARSATLLELLHCSIAFGELVSDSKSCRIVDFNCANFCQFLFF